MLSFCLRRRMIYSVYSKCVGVFFILLSLLYITDCFCPFQIRPVLPSQCTLRNHTVSTAQKTWHLQTLYVLIFCFSFFFYQCLINSPNSAPEESVLQFSSSCPALLILLLCFLLLQMIYREYHCHEFILAWVFGIPASL